MATTPGAEAPKTNETKEEKDAPPAAAAPKTRRAKAERPKVDEKGMVRLSTPVAIFTTPDEEQRPYRVGVRKDCPIQNVTLAGICIQSYSGGHMLGIIGDDGTRTDIPKRPGNVVRLTDDHLSTLLRVISETYVAKVGHKSFKCRVGAPNWPKDETTRSQMQPVGRFIYIQAITEDEAKAEQPEPPALIADAEPVAASA